ncbi:DUF2306 domain-containing protein [Paracraurococcus lichenis]|uniref:DUF2306 domain-containing protein n=1 Tax=Paracraurococcus lichenis TaxID=3064888 RepID=A0ABT9EC31_9PROT|nr:DUF2306 domain-containing protein [Paracraurococcus sp. LOR1-02]MDO9713770.1 DUF2306 domain-containing protein [Paracraurococcus sp. LOR1-02]
MLALAFWSSAALFAAYILVFYIGALPAGTMQDWNKVLPRLYVPDAVPTTIAMAAHLVLGGILLLLGPIQFIGRLRQRAPSLHRWIGRVYGAAALGAGLGGLIFVLGRGTVGGPVMSAGFALYGVLMAVAATQTMRHGWCRRLHLHRAWAIRLFALVIGSWLYRMEYGLWLKLAGGMGHTRGFDGPFDLLMDFLFFVPNLIVAELLIRRGDSPLALALRRMGSVALYAAAGLVTLATFLFGRFYWIPHILARF